MGLISKLFGSSRVVEKGTDMLDNAFYTDQEKAEGHIRLLSAYEPFKIAQRLLALIVVPPWVLANLICFCIWLVNPDYNIEPAMNILNEKLGLAAIAIVSFYFGGGLLNSLKK